MSLSASNFSCQCFKLDRLFPITTSWRKLFTVCLEGKFQCLNSARPGKTLSQLDIIRHLGMYLHDERCSLEWPFVSETHILAKQALAKSKAQAGKDSQPVVWHYCAFHLLAGVVDIPGL